MDTDMQRDDADRSNAHTVSGNRNPCDHCGGLDHRRRYKLDRSWIVECENCEYAFVDPIASSEERLRQLQDWAKKDIHDEERLAIAFDDRTRAIYRSQVRHITKLAGGRSGRLLDVGCSVGSFLTVARSEGWSVEGLEIGAASSKYAREKLDLTIFESLLMSFSPTQKYDAIACLEVIEHLESPSEAISRIAEWLVPGGLLILSTPNFNSLYRRLFGARWWVINCEDEHIAFFTPRTMAAALKKHGFKVVSMRNRGTDFVGLMREMLSRGKTGNGRVDGLPADDPDEHGYYVARRGKERTKTFFRRVGLLSLVRCAMWLLDGAFSLKGSPVYGLGEQLVVIARKARAD